MVRQNRFPLDLIIKLIVLLVVFLLNQFLYIMSVLGNDVCVVSIGISCQTAYQIKKNLELLKKITGDTTLECRRMPFDWLISEPDSVISMIKSENYYPKYLTEIEISNTSYWSKHNCYFWHDTKLLTAKSFHIFQQKYAHITLNFGKITNVKKRVFLISNTQNNLPQVKRQTKNLQINFDLNHIKCLIEIIETKFLGENKFIIVSNKNRIAEKDLNNLELLAPVYCLDVENSKWKGNDSAWTTLLESALDRVLK